VAYGFPSGEPYQPFFEDGFIKAAYGYAIEARERLDMAANIVMVHLDVVRGERVLFYVPFELRVFAVWRPEAREVFDERGVGYRGLFRAGWLFLRGWRYCGLYFGGFYCFELDFC
jgi:hypothetical protein